MLGHNGVMRVNALGFPPVEPRAESQAAAKARRRPAWGARLEACRVTCTHDATCWAHSVMTVSGAASVRHAHRAPPC